MNPILESYARLLVEYCLEIKAGERLYIRSTTLAEPLVREVYRRAIRAGAWVESTLDFQGKGRIFLEEASEEVLTATSPFHELAIGSFDAYLHIKAPFNLREEQEADKARSRQQQQAQQAVLETYFRRTAEGALKRSLCLYPTPASAQEAGMALEDYERFVYRACKLFEDDPIRAWKDLRQQQEKVVQVLNRCAHIHYQGPHIDLQFSTEGRRWINSDGRANMPSGEVFTAPVEDSVQGEVLFSFPSVYMGHEVEGIHLWVKDGYIERWTARRGKDLLDHVFSIPGARRFGEAAIGTNFAIDRMTRNILFDEKMGGTVHLAVGQAYLQAGGKNRSTVHWDMITDMREDAAIYADGEKIYENGAFVIGE